MRFEVKFNSSTQRIPVQFKSLQTISGEPNFEEYQGSYTVIPAVTEQVLATDDCVMREDLVVEKIPFFKVSNTKGGETVTIG